MKRHVPAAALALALAASTLATPSQAQQRYEQPDLNASALAPKALLQGTGYTVDERVTFENFMPRFTIRSGHGVWEARGREMLDIRVSELSALSQLAEVSKGDEFASALGKAAVAPVKVAGDLVTKPLDTTGKLVSGAGIMLGRVGSFVGSTAANTGDRISGADDGRTPIAAGTPALPAGTAPPRMFVGDPLGYNRARREWAQRLKIDPYTTNAPLSDKLGDVAKVSFAGTFAVDLTLGAVVAPLHYSSLAYEQGTLEAYQVPPLDLNKRNEERLNAMGVDSARVRALIRNGYYTPTLQTMLTLTLESMGKVGGRAEVVTFATRAISEVEARYVNNSVVLLANYGRSTPLARVRAFDRFVGAQTPDGKLVVALALDVLPWTDVVYAFANRADLRGKDRQLLVTGTVTPLAKEQLAALGWSVQDRLAFAER
ncbi:MAG TPA: hypothetical protein VHP37_06255 [Burkholderiales bacterium]|nr:hypothetical protein [Burkholderiales bacterium]